VNQQNLPMVLPMSLPMVAPPSDLSEPTARVKVAITYLRDCVVKRMERAAVNDISIEIIPGQPLTDAEKLAQAAAANLLTGYFNGSLPENTWEREQLANSRHGRRPPRINDLRGGKVVNCFSCYPGPVQPNCTFCAGAGTVIVFPSTQEG
jgi:hypothetical protein